MNDDAARVGKLLRQQAAIASFGSFALRQSELLTVLNEAARVCAEGLSVPFCKVCRYRTEENDLLVVAGFGWKAGVVGHVVSRADESSPQGRAFITGQPSICNDLRTKTDYKLPSFYGDHGIVSTIDVVIKGSVNGNDQPYGVLEIDNDKQHNYDQHDIDFLTGFANVLAEAVATAARTATLQTTVERMRGLVDEKDRLLEEQNRLLDQKKVLAAELQHRVRNNLQLVYGMLSKQLDNTKDEAGRRGIKGIARRVSTLAQVYDHLLGNEMTRTTDFGGYVNSLCRSLKAIHSGAITLECDCDGLGLDLDLDVVTALGIVVAELVTNSYDHAFPSGQGEIVVAVHRDAANPAMATMVVSDDGTGIKINGEDKRHGVGLVRRLVEQIGGAVTVDSARGTAWTVSFPATLRGQGQGGDRRAAE
jgi:two-component sensor histidine kinase